MKEEIINKINTAIQNLEDKIKRCESKEQDTFDEFWVDEQIKAKYQIEILRELKEGLGGKDV